MTEPRVIRSLGIEQEGQAYFFEYTEGPLPPNHFRVETLYTGLSSGTEMTFLHATNPYLRAGWDAEYGLFRQGQPSIRFPLPFLGYMEVGRVIESSTPWVEVGKNVAMAYGHKSGHTADAANEYYCVLPDDLPAILGIYVAQMGPICANGLLHAAADRVGPDVRSLGDGVQGRNVVVFGAGVIGQLTALFAKLHGAAEVVIFNSTGPRLDAAKALGLCAVSEQEAEPWLYCKERWHYGPQDRGADIVFQCKPATASLAAALRCLRPRSTVIDMAFYQGGAGEVHLGEEFHHNGLTIRCAQINNLPWGLERAWSRSRLSAETVTLLQQCGDAVRKHLITDIVPFDEAPAFLGNLCSSYHPATIQAVFELPAAQPPQRSAAERIQAQRVAAPLAEAAAQPAAAALLHNGREVQHD